MIEKRNRQKNKLGESENKLEDDEAEKASVRGKEREYRVAINRKGTLQERRIKELSENIYRINETSVEKERVRGKGRKRKKGK